MTHVFVWLEQTYLSVWIRETTSIFAFPLILFLHTLGLAMLAGISVAIDVWILRTRTFVSDARMTGYIRTMWLGFGINTVSGLALLFAYPAKALTNPVFFAKMLLVVIGVLAMARINRELFASGSAVVGAVVTHVAKRWAVISLLGLNVLAFYSLEARKVLALGPNGEASVPARCFAGVSLCLLVAIMCAGRMLTFFRP